MEPSTKKRKLAPKVEPLTTNASLQHQPPPPFPAPPPQSAHYPHDLVQSQPPPPPPQQQYAVQEPNPARHDFESFARHLQDAAMLVQRQTERPAYTDVSVLLLRWEDDAEADARLDALEPVFQREYRYTTQRWHIPTVANPSIKLGVEMASFLEHARPDHLLIIYYSGHGYVGADGHLYWACNGQETSPKMKWDGVRCLFEDAQPNILLLLDTVCIPNPPMTGRHGTKQVICASAPDAERRGNPDRQFTARLKETLLRFAGGRPFSVQRLYDEMVMLQRQQSYHPESQVANGASAAATNGPLLFTLTSGKAKGLTLAPLGRAAATTAHDGGEMQPGRPLDSLIDSESVADLRFDESRVLVCTTFVGDASPDMSYFHQWVQESASLRGMISVEGMFLGPPTMLLISMPHSVWNVVQHDKVCCFLGYISSHNMLHLYERLVGPAGIRPSKKEVEDGRILLEARERASDVSQKRESLDHHRDADDRMKHIPPYGSVRAKDEAGDSAEMRKAAEGLKALSDVTGRREDASPTLPKPRTILPDSPSTSVFTGDAESKNGRVKLLQRAIPKQESRCSHCSHAPFKDSSSLRKHIAAAHTRPFPCAFSFAGCNSAFGSKNEWKRHISSQHLCLQYYRCSDCSSSGADGRGSEFNRKDLFTQHLRRMHAPHQVKRAMAKNDGKLLTEWETRVREMQQSCLVTRRKPPQRSACPKPECQSTFEGPGAWDEWTEHVGRHMEKGEAQRLGVDSLLASWALDEGIIEATGDGEYKLCASNFVANGNVSGLERDCSATAAAAVAAGEGADTRAKSAEEEL